MSDPSPRAAALLPPLDFASLLEKSPNPYVVVDRDLVMVWMNDAYLAVTARQREELTGKGMFDAFPSPVGSESYRLLHRSFAKVMVSGEVDEIAHIRYDITRPDGTLEVRYWSASHTPVLDREGQVAFILQHTVDITELQNLRQLRDEMGVVERANRVQARNSDLSEETARLRTLFEQAPGFVAILEGEDHRFVLANAAYRRITGRKDLMGKPVAQALPEVVGQGFIELLDDVLRQGKPFVGRRVKVLLGDGPEEATTHFYLDFIYQPIINDDGAATGVFVQGHDVTDQVEAEDRQKLLINELNHRVKNTLSIVQGLALQSFRRVENSEAAQRTFESRLNALAAAHTLLTEHDWEVAEISEVLRRSVDATAGSDGSRVDIAGPSQPLQPQTAVTLAMVVHELSTNAIKYGALSQPAGRVDLHWTVSDLDDTRQLMLIWVERDGPPVAPPTRRGFGTRLVERGISTDLKGGVELDFAPGGLRCRIEARLPKEPA